MYFTSPVLEIYWIMVKALICHIESVCRNVFPLLAEKRGNEFSWFQCFTFLLLMMLNKEWTSWCLYEDHWMLFTFLFRFMPSPSPSFISSVLFQLLLSKDCKLFSQWNSPENIQNILFINVLVISSCCFVSFFLCQVLFFVFNSPFIFKTWSIYMR